ncbi:hypothetical protein OJ996_11900 [Luteolibacter sp. GHJ8]|uniref:HEAT repeat domain-containing protein n=1 Tax=Luteolibacter rhizosphaerae TaxID=2989719 RepID=A0ABT3G372_9BACT|nr:hypothetical protein [Luteolibacter rhizosphaerae]MCW1914283.1 hypothetical protein [Luteolibacter rhizosphaerae]
MKPRNFLLAGGVVLLIAAGVIFVSRPKGEPLPGVTENKLAQEPATKSEGRPDAVSPEKRKEASVKAEPLSDEKRIEILNEIEQASVTYDAKALPQIEPYLLHPDAEVRAAAMNGMIVLGDSAAAPLLRKAAESASTPKESVALSEAADYMELPAGTFVPKQRAEQSGGRKPLEGKQGERKRLSPKPAGEAVEEAK